MVKGLKFLRGVVRLDGFGLDDDTRVAFLIVLALGRNRPRHVTTCERHCPKDEAQK